MLYVIRQIYTSTTHTSADFFAVHLNVKYDVTDYIAISPAYRSTTNRRFPAILKRDGPTVSNHVFSVIAVD